MQNQSPTCMRQTHTPGSVAEAKHKCTYIVDNTTILSHSAFKDPSLYVDISMQNEHPEVQTGISFSVAFCHVG